jgi:hypothetical protein
VRFGDAATCAETKGRSQVDDVGDLREVGQLGADFSRDSRQTLRDESDQLARGLRDGGAAQESPQRGG